MRGRHSLRRTRRGKSLLHQGDAVGMAYFMRTLLVSVYHALLFLSTFQTVNKCYKTAIGPT